jgi:hypothetical protein
MFALRASRSLPPNSVISVSIREPGQKGELVPLGVAVLSFSTVVPQSLATAYSTLHRAQGASINDLLNYSPQIPLIDAN